ncbi:NADH-quinone oxidoreductase subunit G [uncultured Campylobacter sp.]|uniref:NADH-quinone oxidoreductase subunit G n=1 Tax=uncultured Campylobacter sp. TaxID=218934 RepID=UPI00260CFEB4|nr:NADH-quinone oxidoreductase subunit G [uncultured Campylobacter sp.]
MAKITIDGKACECDEGEYILQVARRCGVFIPALCYLSGGTPTLACRLCMVEADSKRVYSCNAKAKDGMVVYSRSPEIDAEREAITQVYCINHPMACGVCDQSGECELQNLAHLMRTNAQSYAIRDTAREVQDWGYLSYDPSLCIVCERCITAAKDRLGVDAFKLVPRGGDAPSKEQKDAMPKDAYAVWNKLQKSLIARVNENDDCVNYGESAAVCPTGALVESAFKYVSNAWELRQIPASNPHSSDCELLYYEVKRRGIGEPRERIYRVSSDINFSVLHAGARFGWDFSNERASKNDAVFNRIVRDIEDGEIKNIKFNSFITNEEAQILELLRQKFKLALINDEALAYQKFLREFSKLSGTKFYNADSQTVKNSDFIVVCGTFLRSDAPNMGYAVNSACKLNKASGIYFHPFCDEGIKGFGKNFIHQPHAAGLEAQILLWILQKFGRNLPEWLDAKLAAEFKISRAAAKQNLDEKPADSQNSKNSTEANGAENVASESGAKNSASADGGTENPAKNSAQNSENVTESKISNFARTLGLDEQKVDDLLAKKESFSLIIGEDFIRTPNSATLARLAGLVQRYTPFKVLLVPPRTNSLGVALICELSAQENAGETLGYNEAGDISFGVLEADLDAPSLVQQEGTFTNYDKRVVPTNAALDYGGYELNDIACALGVCAEHAISYTSNLGADFEQVKFDDLENFYDNGGANHRGYELRNEEFVASEEEFEISPSAPLRAGEGEILIYEANPLHQFNKFSGASSALGEAGALYLNPSIAEALGVSAGDVVKIYQADDAGHSEKTSGAGKTGAADNESDKDGASHVKKADRARGARKADAAGNENGESGATGLVSLKREIVASVKIDRGFSGAYLPYFDEKLGGKIFFKTSRYASVKIEKISNSKGEGR